MRYSLQYCQVLNNITVATKIKLKIFQNFTHPLYYLLKLIEWQRIEGQLSRACSGITAKLPAVYRRPIMTHSTVKCPKRAYYKEQKTLERAILSGLLRDYRKATCSTPTTHF